MKHVFMESSLCTAITLTIFYVKIALTPIYSNGPDHRIANYNDVLEAHISDSSDLISAT